MFRKYAGDRALILGAISLISTMTEGLGIALFISYIQFLGSNNSEPGFFLEQIRNSFSYLHLPFETPYVVVVLISIFLIRAIFVVLAKGYHFQLYTRITASIHEDLSQTIASMRYTDYLKRNSGFFSHIVTTEAHRSLLAYYQIAAIIPIVVAVCTYLALSVRIEWRFTLLAIAFGLFTALTFRIINRHTASLSRKLSAIESEMQSLIIQLLHSFKYLFSTASIEPLRKQISDASYKVAKTGSRIGFISALLPASSETVIIAFLGTMLYLQTEVFDREVGAMIIAMMFLYRAMRETSILQGSWQTFNQYLGGVDSVFNLIKELGDNREKSGAQAFNGFKNSLSLENLSFAYGDSDVLRNISLSIKSKSMVAFVGESGAGKSTLVDILTGLMLPTSGQIRIDSVSYTDLDRQSLRSHIGYVTQENVMFDDSVANNISLWSWKQHPNGLQRITDALRRAHCLDFINALPEGIQTRIGERGLRLSGGQRQRLSIARELYRSPSLLILDEATSALDSESERQVQQSVDSLKGSTTIVVIAHRLATVKNCDHIFVLQKGALVESGTFKELKANGKIFSKMCEAQGLT